MRLERKRDVHVHGQIVIEICLHRRNRNNVPAINEVHHSPSEIPLRQAGCECVQEHSAPASECQQFGYVTCSKNDSYAHTLYISTQLYTAYTKTGGQALERISGFIDIFGRVGKTTPITWPIGRKSPANSDAHTHGIRFQYHIIGHKVTN